MSRCRGALAFTRAWVWRHHWSWVGFGWTVGSVRDVAHIGWWSIFIPRWGEAPEAGWKWEGRRNDNE